MSKIHKRNCILCGEDNTSKIFNFTYSFLKNVRKSNPEKKYGWDETTNNWIVECKNCKCTYVNEIIKGNSQDTASEKIDNQQFKVELNEFYNPSNLVNNLHDLNYNESILINILNNLKKKKDITLLDYGSGNAEFSMFKKKFHLKEIISYDPLYPKNINEIFQTLSIESKATNTLDNIINIKKFDIIICQSVIEHVTNPDLEISNMKKLLNDGGIIYINNPYMNIKKDLNKLKNAKTVKKSDSISCYHVDHVNYMMPNIFLKLCKKNNLDILNFWQKFYSTNKKPSLNKLFKINTFSLVHYILNSFKIYYKKQHFFLKLR
ncbi:MAG: hypothetical protein CMK44_00170 [Porticoccus sp.]|jgi:2-polyprenyl-3-methyl-5-hydroxy-6-metoxy-1,4-benzoquinol methylase|nr:hypothetical protein [Porticoccus sp.]|tara:strand:- start:115 stop:1074 length:960 start_codon:yes stop_codon:yes gene_type:complete